MTTTPELDDRLTDLLARTGAAVDVRPGLDAVLADDRHRSPVVDLGRRPRETRRLLALAAAVALVLGLAGAAALVTRDDDQPLDVAQPAAAGPLRFPVLGHVPSVLEGAPVAAVDGRGGTYDLRGSFGPEVDVVRTAVGRVAADGTVSDIIQLGLAAGSVEEGVAPPPPGEVEDLGGGYRLMALVQEVWLYGPDVTVTAVGGPETEALVRSLVPADPTTAPTPDETLLTTMALPDGFTVIAPSTVIATEEAEIVVQGEDGSQLVAETGVGPPELTIMSPGGTATPVDIAGGAGFVSTDRGPTRVAWTAPTGVTVQVISDAGEDEALAIARGLQLVDEATWRATYPQGGDEEERPGPPNESGEPATTDPDAPTTSTPDGTTAPDPTTTDGATTDEAAIDAAFHTAFDADVPEEERFAAVEDGPALVEAGREAVARYPEAADSISVTVHDVEVVAPDRATVVFELLYDDAQLLGRQTGEAVLLDGAWKVTRETRCEIIRRAGVACP